MGLLGTREAHSVQRTPVRSAEGTLSICLINPRFEPSYWGFDYALPLYPGDKRCTMISGALPTLAGLVPAGHEVVLVDENVQPIDFEALRRFDEEVARLGHRSPRGIEDAILINDDGTLSSS